MFVTVIGSSVIHLNADISLSLNNSYLLYEKSKFYDTISSRMTTPLWKNINNLFFMKLNN